MTRNQLRERATQHEERLTAAWDRIDQYIAGLRAAVEARDLGLTYGVVATLSEALTSVRVISVTAREWREAADAEVPA